MWSRFFSPRFLLWPIAVRNTQGTQLFGIIFSWQSDWLTWLKLLKSPSSPCGKFIALHLTQKLFFCFLPEKQEHGARRMKNVYVTYVCCIIFRTVWFDPEAVPGQQRDTLQVELGGEGCFQPASTACRGCWLSLRVFACSRFFQITEDVHWMWRSDAAHWCFASWTGCWCELTF